MSFNLVSMLDTFTLHWSKRHDVDVDVVRAAKRDYQNGRIDESEFIDRVTAENLTPQEAERLLEAMAG